MLHYKTWVSLKPGDRVDIIAPSAKWVDGEVKQVQHLLTEWGLVAHIPKAIYGPDLLCANSDEQRFLQLKNALIHPDSAAVWCLRGGYGATRLIPSLLALAIPAQTKLFIGLSDITALHIFLQDQWGWQTVHAPCAGQIAAGKIHELDIDNFKQLIFGIKQRIDIQLTPINNITRVVSAPITGGNLSLVQTSIGTQWQINTVNKILFLEDVNERAYRIDRILVHLAQAGLFDNAQAIVFGDFISSLEPNDHSLIKEVLTRFAAHQSIPVYTCNGIGHGFRNAPLPLGRFAEIDHQYQMLRIKG